MESHCGTGWAEFWLSVVDRDVQADRSKRKMLANIYAVLKLLQRVDTAVQLKPKPFRWHLLQSQLFGRWLGVLLPTSSAYFCPENTGVCN